MSLTFECYEDWGPVTIGPPNRGQNRTLVTNANLKSISDANQHYYLNEVRRPSGSSILGPLATFSFRRFLSWKITGAYAGLKNIRIEIPSGFAQDNWSVQYRLTNQYEEDVAGVDEFGFTSGVYDGRMIALTEGVTLFPRVFYGTGSAVGPQYATDRQTIIPYQSGYEAWTEWLVLQITCYASNYDDVDNYGTETIMVKADEMEIV